MEDNKITQGAVPGFSDYGALANLLMSFLNPNAAGDRGRKSLAASSRWDRNHAQAAARAAPDMSWAVPFNKMQDSTQTGMGAAPMQPPMRLAPSTPFGAKMAGSTQTGGAPVLLNPNARGLQGGARPQQVRSAQIGPQDYYKLLQLGQLRMG
jgi:hypothetical protein